MATAADHKGIARRASAASALPPSTLNSSSTRVHRSNDSHHGFVGTHPTNAGIAAYSPAGAAGSPQGKVVLALIKRLTSKLPFYSGLSLTDIESDDAVQLIIESLVELARHALDIIVWKLSEELEKLAKTEIGGRRTLDVLQSEVFLLKVMSVTLAYRWQQRKPVYSSRHPHASSDSPTPYGNGHYINGSGGGGAVSTFSSPVPSPSGTAHAQHSHSHTSTHTQQQKRMRPGSSSNVNLHETLSTSSLWLDAPPLDEACARWLISVMILLLRLAAPRDDRTRAYANLSADATLFGFESVDCSVGWSFADKMPWIPSSVASASTSTADVEGTPHEILAKLPRKTPSLTSVSSNATSPIPLPRSALGFQPTPRTLISSSLPLHSLIVQWAGNIVYLLSAANWSVVLSKIKTKIHQLSRNGYTTEEFPDITDLQLLQYCAMDRTRLVKVLQELSSLLVNMNRDAQASVAISLRYAIWNWIETFPNEYLEVVTGVRRLDGAPERVFDLFFQVCQSCDDATRRTIWPTLTALILLSSDRMSQIALASAQGLWNMKPIKKEVSFVDQVRKNLSPNSKLSDVAMLCVIDLCRAAAYVAIDHEVPLRSFAPELADDLKTRLWKAQDQRPFWEGGDTLDVALYSDALVVLCHFLPEDEYMQLLLACLEPERSDAVKMCTVKAYTILDQQAEKWHWRVSAMRLWAKIGPRVKKIFRSAICRKTEMDSTGAMRRSSIKPSSKRYSSETIADRELLILSVLALFRVDPRGFLYERNSAEIESYLADAMQLIVRPGDPAISLSALRTFTDVASWVDNLQPNDEFFERGRSWLGLAIPAALQAAASRLLDARDDFDEQRNCAEMAYSLVLLYTRCVDTEMASSWDFASGRLPAMVVAELAFLVTLTSADIVVSTLAARALREMAIAEGSRMTKVKKQDQQIAQTQVVEDDASMMDEPKEKKPEEEEEEEEGNEADEAAKRFPIYDQLGDPSVLAVVPGRVAQQKRVRKLLRLLTRTGPLHAAVWHECFWRWSALKESVARRSIDSDASSEDFINVVKSNKPTGDRTLSPEERMDQWQNLTLFLASFGAVSVLDQVNTGATLANVIPIKYLPDRFRILQDGEAMIHNFIVSSVEFLISRNPRARDTVKEALGSELTPRLYPRLFKQLNDAVEDVTRAAKEAEGVPDDEEEKFLRLFFDQLLILLKLLVDRSDSPSEDVLGNTDLNQSLLSLTKFMDRFQEDVSLRLKIKFCNFCEIALSRTDAFGLRKDDFVRNNLIDIVVEWIQPQHSRDDFNNPESQARHDMNVAALRTMVKLLERLRLQPLDVSSGDDATHVVSRRFMRYQNVLLHALKYKRFDLVDDGDLTSPSNISILKLASEMRDLVITGLAHLLTTNTDIGLKHFLPLGYDPDPGRRAIFCHVVSRVMDLGGKFETASDAVVASRRIKIGELVKGSDMVLVLAICETCPPGEVDVIVPVILNLFDSRASLLALLKLLVEREVKTTTSEVALFRGNSMRMKLLCAFARMHGYDYLRKVIQPVLQEMRELASTNTFLLDPDKASEDEIEQNQKVIKVFAQGFVNIVSGSFSIMPLMLREVCHHIAATVSEVWPEARFAAVGAFIFLRFISPALVSPDTIDIDYPVDNTNFRRGLLVITKIIQNLANNVRFGKEQHMMVFNDFLSDNIVRVMKFLTDIQKYSPTAVEDDPDEWQGGTFDETDAIVLHRFFEKHADKVGKELLSLTKSSKEGEAAVVGGKKAWDTLCAALVDMGQPVEIPRLSKHSSISSEEYREFMARNDDRNTESVSDLFHEVRTLKNDVAVFHLAICKFDIEVLDFELLVYHAFKVISSPLIQDKEFEIVIDCTSYTTASEIPMQWFKYFIELVPSDIRERFRTAHLMNCNQAMQRFLRKLYNICSGIFSIEIRTYFSVEELSQTMGADLAGVLTNTWTLEQETKEHFANIMIRQAHHMKVPIKLAVAQSHLRIDTVKPQSVYPGFTCRSSEIVPYIDVGDIYNIATGKDTNQFIIRRSRNGSTLYFSSSERELIVKAIRSAKSRMNTSRAIFFDRFSRLSNVSAALLNIAMFNTYQDNADLRGAAYNLLAAVCNSLNFGTETFLPSTGGFIPGQPSTYITQLSEKLALFAPQLTLDFISQVCLELDKSVVQQKAISLQYMNPWIKNLNKFCNPSHKLYEMSGAKLRDCVRILIDLTVRDVEAYYIMQKYTWTEVGKLDSAVVNVVLDEVMRAAVDGGMGSSRCDMMAEVLSSMNSMNVRGRILAKLRRALGKTSTKPSRTLDKNVHWNEITTYARLALGSGCAEYHTIHNHVLVPEVIHLVTLLAGQGDLRVRNTIFGLALQILQSLFVIHSEDPTLASEIRGLINDLTQPKTMRHFGLERFSSTSEYTIVNNADDQNALEGLSKWLLKAISIGAGNSGLANVWRARWMGLLTGTAFQLSPSIQPRAFVIMGTLASSDVDDDLLYQMLVALRSAMKAADESDTHCVVSMLHCVCSVVPALTQGSRYIGSLFWLAVALLQCSHAPFYIEANSLLCACIKTLQEQHAFEERGFVTTLLDARSALDPVSSQFDHILDISFDSDFAFSLAAIIFKGIRRPQFKQSAKDTLRCLLTTTMSTFTSEDGAQTESVVHQDVLGYFIALLSVSSTPQAYRELLNDARVDPSWVPRTNALGRLEDDADQVPRVPFDIFGCVDRTTALLAISFMSSMLSSAQGDDVETQMLFAILKDAAASYPEIVSWTYESLSEKVHDMFTNSSNPAILSSVSTIFRIAMEDAARNAVSKSSTTLSTVEEDSGAVLSEKLAHALAELNMQGLRDTFLFLPTNAGHVTKVLLWFPELISKIIE